MDFIYTTLIQRFKDNETLFNDEGLLPVKHFDMFKGQYIYPELHLAYKKPALFFQFRTVWKSFNEYTQDGTVTLTLHVELENYGHSAGYSRNRDYALQVFDTHRRINALMHGFSSSQFTPLMRIENNPDDSPVKTNVELITYQTSLRDDTALQFREMGLIKEPLDEVSTPSQVPVRQAPQPDTSKYTV